MKKKLGLFIITMVAITLSACSKQSAEVDNDIMSVIKERGKIIIGTEGTYAPFSYHEAENNVLTGYDVEVARAIAEELGVEVEFVEAGWDSLLGGLDAKRFDLVMNQVAITEERQEKYLFSKPYTISRAVLITRQEEKEINRFEEVKGKKLAQSLTSNYAILAEDLGAEVVATDGLFSKAIELLLSNRVDATINDEISYYDYIGKKEETAIKVVATLDAASENAILLRKNSKELQTAINQALESLRKKGRLTELSMKYFGVDVSE